jgi:hypothetical protein
MKAEGTGAPNPQFLLRNRRVHQELQIESGARIMNLPASRGAG